jgi:hypothetical protein
MQGVSNNDQPLNKTIFELMQQKSTSLSINEIDDSRLYGMM